MFQFVYIITYFLIPWHVIFVFFLLTAVTAEIGVCVLQYFGTHTPQKTYSTVQFSRIITTPLTPKFNFSLTSVSQWSTFSFLVYSCEVFLFSHTFWNIVITFLVYFFTFLCPSIFLPLFCCLSRMFVMKKLLIIMMRCCEWLSLNTSHRGTLHWSVSDHTRNSLAYFVCRKSNRRIASKSFSW